MPYFAIFIALVLVAILLQVLFALRASMDNRPISKARITFNMVYIISLSAFSASTIWALSRIEPSSAAWWIALCGGALVLLAAPFFFRGIVRRAFEASAK